MVHRFPPTYEASEPWILPPAVESLVESILGLQSWLSCSVSATWDVSPALSWAQSPICMIKHSESTMSQVLLPLTLQDSGIQSMLPTPKQLLQGEGLAGHFLRCGSGC